MRRRGWFGLLLVAGLLAGLLVVPGAAAQGPDIQLALLLDSSGSIGADWGTITAGVADALENPDCFPHDGSVELTVIQFATSANVIVGPVVIDSLATAQAEAAVIRGIGGGSGGTNMTAAFNLAATELSGSTNFDASLRQVVNVVTDGVPNSTTNAAAARGTMITTLQMTEEQDEIDAEGIGVLLDIDWLRDNIVYPQPGYIAPPFDQGPGWVRQVADAQELADTMCEKFQVIIEEPVGGTTYASDLWDVIAPWMIAALAGFVLLGGLAAARLLTFRREKA